MFIGTDFGPFLVGPLSGPVLLPYHNRECDSSICWRCLFGSPRSEECPTHTHRDCPVVGPQAWHGPVLCHISNIFAGPKSGNTVYFFSQLVCISFWQENDLCHVVLLRSFYGCPFSIFVFHMNNFTWDAKQMKVTFEQHGIIHWEMLPLEKGSLRGCLILFKLC